MLFFSADFVLHDVTVYARMPANCIALVDQPVIIFDCRMLFFSADFVLHDVTVYARMPANCIALVDQPVMLHPSAWQPQPAAVSAFGGSCCRTAMKRPGRGAPGCRQLHPSAWQPQPAAVSAFGGSCCRTAMKRPGRGAPCRALALGMDGFGGVFGTGRTTSPLPWHGRSACSRRACLPCSGAGDGRLRWCIRYRAHDESPTLARSVGLQLPPRRRAPPLPPLPPVLPLPPNAAPRTTVGAATPRTRPCRRGAGRRRCRRCRRCCRYRQTLRPGPLLVPPPPVERRHWWANSGSSSQVRR